MGSSLSPAGILRTPSSIFKSELNWQWIGVNVLAIGSSLYSSCCCIAFATINALDDVVFASNFISSPRAKPFPLASTFLRCYLSPSGPMAWRPAAKHSFSGLVYTTSSRPISVADVGHVSTSDSITDLLPS